MLINIAKKSSAGHQSSRGSCIIQCQKLWKEEVGSLRGRKIMIKRQSSSLIEAPPYSMCRTVICDRNTPNHSRAPSITACPTPATSPFYSSPPPNSLSLCLHPSICLFLSSSFLCSGYDPKQHPVVRVYWENSQICEDTSYSKIHSDPA